MEEARERLERYGPMGVGVAYKREHCAVEQGYITSVGDRFVFVNYGNGSTSAATDPADLSFLAP